MGLIGSGCGLGLGAGVTSSNEMGLGLGLMGGMLSLGITIGGTVSSLGLGVTGFDAKFPHLSRMKLANSSLRLRLYSSNSFLRCSL